jgi:Mrp family chromosome partitioning ATPase
MAETLGNYANLQVMQRASPAVRDFTPMKKPLAIILAGGLLLGIGLALLCEFVLDQSVRHSAELRSHFNLPILATIPDVDGKTRRSKGKMLAPPGKTNGEASVGRLPAATLPAATSGGSGHLNSYFGALRDRTVMYLERMTHKPKLVAVTGSDAHSGVTTIATGLAKALSETAEGRVLLVDMTSESGTSHPFLNGKPSCALSEMLDQDKAASVHENLFVATVVERPEGPLPIVPKRFASLIPKLKASDYDYVVFDMPPVTQTSITPRLAALMDIVLLVVESERSQRNGVRRATEALTEAKANVRGVLNKHRTYIPKWLYQEQ